MNKFLFAALISIFSINAFSQTAATKAPLKDPVVKNIDLKLDLANSSKKIVSAISVDGIISDESIPTMNVKIHQSGKRVMTGSGELPVDFMTSPSGRKVEFIYEANIDEQKFTLSELSADLKAKIQEKNPDMVSAGGTIKKAGQNKRYYNSIEEGISPIERSSSGYIYPSTYVRVTAIDPILIILSRTYLQTNGISDGSSIIWCNAYYYHLWKQAGGYSWPNDTTWFRESGSINWPTPNSWTSSGYSTSTQASYANWDWG